MKQLDGSDRWIFREGLHEHVAKCVRLRRTTDLTAGPLRRVINARDRAFRRDSPRGSGRHAAEGGHLPPRVIRPTQHLNLVSLQHVDHPFPRRRPSLRRSGPVGLPRGGQNFRKRLGQNFRNPQRATIGTIRLHLLRVAERVVRRIRRLWFHLASHWPGQPSSPTVTARSPAHPHSAATRHIGIESTTATGGGVLAWTSGRPFRDSTGPASRTTDIALSVISKASRHNGL